MNFTLRFPNNLIFGENTVDQLGEHITEFGNKCIIVTGRKSTKESGALDRVIKALKINNVKYVIYDDLRGEPDTYVVDNIRTLAKNENVDFVIGLGGGSALDAAKASAGLYGQKLPTVEYLEKKPFEYKGIPFVAIPTTSGTGSEVTLNAVLHNPIRKNKNSIAHPKFQAKLSIVDPTLTYSMPPWVAAASGMDALTHAIESYTSKAANPITMALAAKAIELIGKSLVKVIDDNIDVEAKSNMALASTTAALAFSQTGVGVAHSISHPLGALFGIAHGIANAILLPVVIDYNDKECSDKYQEIAKLLGSDKKASECIRELLNKMPIPKSLRDAGYKDGKEREIIKRTFESRSLMKNPREVKENDILDILKKCV